MNAIVQPARMLCAMRESDLDSVLAIEQAAYAFPWTRGNFLDSLRGGYAMQVLLTPDNGLVGFFVVLAGVGELHLLNLSVAPTLQGRGHGRYMLDAVLDMAREQRARQVWLEVRASNERARALYERYGFRRVGLRRRYYPAQAGREDAVVMSWQLSEAAHGLG